MKLKLYIFLFLLLSFAGLKAQTPVDGLTGVSILPSFSWTDPGGTTYLQISTTSGDYNSPVIEIDVSGSSSYSLSESDFSSTPGGLSNNTTYYWRISDGAGGASATLVGEFHFGTINNVSISLATPSNGAVVQTNIAASFYWALGQAVGNLKFMIQVTSGATDAAGWSAADFSTTTTNISASFSLLGNKTYYWRVIVINSSNEVLNYSSTYSFTTTGGAVVPSLATPSNGATVYSETPSFYWTINNSGTDLSYDLIIDNDADPNNGTSVVGGSFTNISDLFYALGSGVIFQGNSYYWSVRSVYKRGTADEEVSNWATSWFFSVSGGINVNITHSFPANGSTVYTNSPYLYWYLDQYAYGVSFVVRYAKSSSVDGNGALNDGTEDSLAATTDLYNQLSGLDPGTIYWWQVSARYNGQVGTWTTPTSFTTNGSGTLFVPTVSYPISGVTVYTTAPTLYWYVNGSSTGLVFDIEIVESSAAFTGIPTYNDVNALFFQLTSALIPGKTYKWQVRSDNGVNVSSFSSMGTFTVDGGITKGYPVASWPIGNPTVYTATPTVYWYLEGSSLGLTQYHLTWKKDSPPADWTAYHGGANPKVIISDLNQTYYTFTSDLEYGATYYWAVASFDGSTHSSWSEGSFTVVGGAGTAGIVLSQPSDGTTIYQTNTNLNWYLNGPSSGITGYEVVYSKSDVFAPSVTTTIAAGTQGTNTFASISGLTPGATYFWKVTPYYGATPGTVSSTWSFLVDAGASPLQPVIGGPTNNISVNTSSPTLSWTVLNETESTLKYKLEIKKENEDWSSADVIDGLSDPFSEINSLNAGQKYEWRVSSYTNDGTYSYYSGTGKFKVGDNVTEVSNEELIPNKFTVSQNYPNPFNPSTTIKYGLPEATFISIKVFNLLGQEVKTLFSGEQNSGTYEITWNGEDDYGSKVASGAYIYRVATSSDVVTKKMVLLK